MYIKAHSPPQIHLMRWNRLLWKARGPRQLGCRFWIAWCWPLVSAELYNRAAKATARRQPAVLPDFHTRAVPLVYTNVQSWTLLPRFHTTRNTTADRSPLSPRVRILISAGADVGWHPPGSTAVQNMRVYTMTFPTRNSQGKSKTTDCQGI